MSKSNHFFGQSVFGQLISMIERSIVTNAVKKTNGDRYVKKFKTWDHLISMLFVSLSGCTSLRELSGAMLGMKGKVSHFQLNSLPYKSTLSDANKRRPKEVFSQIYAGLLKKYQGVLSDSRSRQMFGKELHIIDSTTISLYKDFLKCVGRKSKTGKAKGGIKMHTMINANEPVPRVIHFTDAAHHDQQMYKHLNFKSGHIYVFDKGYNNYDSFELFNDKDIGYVTRLKDNAAYELMIDLDIPWDSRKSIIKDQIVELPIRKNGQVVRTITGRLVTFWDEATKRSFVFLTNQIELEAIHVAEVYKQRWQIEQLYKQLKQNFPLQYFLGDNANAVIIQIWSALIANLLLVILDKSVKRKWSFSNLASFIRINLINYLHLFRFLENPQKDWSELYEINQLKLSLYDG